MCLSILRNQKNFKRIAEHIKKIITIDIRFFSFEFRDRGIIEFGAPHTNSITKADI